MTDPSEPRPADETEPAAETAAESESTPESVTDSTDSDQPTNESDSADASESSPSESDAAKASESESDSAKPDDDLPEWEPLTPEDIEDEAIRGDFMLRWAVVLLAFLLGCREIGETMTLVRVRTGEAIAANGFWPPSTDTFSYSAGDRPWINPAWLFDLVLSGVWNVGGDLGLSLLTALIAAVTFYLLVNISRTDLPTWWTAICAAVALLMAQSQFTALPELITLLGTVWMLRGLLRWSQSGESRELWCLAGSLAVWSNLDPRAFIGWLIFAAFAGGTYLSRRGSTDPGGGSLKDLGKAVGIGLVALMINPAGWHAVLSPLQVYGFENATLLSYAGPIDSVAEAQLLSLFDPRFPDTLNLASIAALVLGGIALLSCIANHRQLDMGLVTAFAATVVLAIICSHELSVVALTASVLAALNGQDWYRERCRQEYTTETLEVLWSRSGRALTVLSMACVAWLAISGRMMGPDGRRVGIGFASWFQAAVDGTEQDLAELPDERLFVMRIEHGDLLVWHQRPTFIDSRVGLYGEEIVKRHDQVRHALRSRLDQSASPATSAAATPLARERADWRGQSKLWREAFDEFDIGLVTPRLWGAGPDYVSLLDIMGSGDWSLLTIGSTLAGLTPKGPDAPEPIHLLETAFRECRSPESENQRVSFPVARTAYQEFLSVPSRNWSPLAMRAQHQQAIAGAAFSEQVGLSKGDVMALSLLALRDANIGLIDTPGNDVVYKTIADSQSALRLLEDQAAGADAPIVGSQRYYQRVHFLRQALTITPNDPDLLVGLAQEYFAANRWDLTLEMIDRFLETVADNEKLSKRFAAPVRQFQSVRVNLMQRKSDLEERLGPVVADKSIDMVPVAAGLRSQGFPLRALELLKDNELAIAGKVQGQVELGMLLIECGRLAEAADVVAQLEPFAEDPSIPVAWTLQAAWLDQARGDQASAILRCERKLRQLEVSSIQAMLTAAPFVNPMPQLVVGGNTWPVSQAVLSGSVFRARDEVAVLRWTVATAYLESGECSQAARTLNTLLESEPNSVLRPVAALYLGLITGEDVPMEPPGEQIPILFVDGPEDPEPPKLVIDPEPEAEEDAKEATENS